MLISIIVGAFVIVVLQEKLRPRKGKSPVIRCVNNLKNVGLAFRIYAIDHNDQFPGAILASNNPTFSGIDAATVFKSLSNELSIPKIVLCPADKNRVSPAHFGNLANTNVSYFASISATTTNSSEFLGGDGNLHSNGKPAAGLIPLNSNLRLTWSKDVHNGRGNILLVDL